MRLADLVKEGRRRKGLKPVELARKAQVSPSTVTRIESGKTVAGRGDTLARITKALGIAPADMQSALREEEAEKARHYVDLEGIPEQRRTRLIRMIDALVRAYKEEEPEEEG